MKPSIVLLLVFLSGCSICLSQPSRAVQPTRPKEATGWHIGLSFGALANTVEMDFSDKPLWRYSVVGSWQYPGLEVHYSLGPRVLATFGLNVLQRGQKVETFQKFAGVNDFTLMRTYVNLPLGIAIDLFDSKFSPYIGIGIYGAYWVSGKWTGSVYQMINNPYDENYDFGGLYSLSFEAPYEFSTGSDVGIKENRAELGAWSGGGLKYQTQSGLRIFLGLNASMGLTAIYSNTREIKDFEKRRNAGRLLNAGLTFPIVNRKK